MDVSSVKLVDDQPPAHADGHGNLLVGARAVDHADGPVRGLARVSVRVQGVHSTSTS